MARSAGGRHAASRRVLTLAAAATTAVAAVAAIGGCTHSRQMADIGFQPPEGGYRLIVMRPDVTVGVLTAGSGIERREDWTNTARANILRAVTAQQAQRGGSVRIAETRAAAGGDPAAVADLDRLHDAVGGAIRRHKYGSETSPTKMNRFDWTLGEAAVQFGRASGFDYALFLHVEDSFSSSGRMMVQAVAAVGCVVGYCVMPHGGRQAAFASLVDLKTGRIVWFNTLASNKGDIRRAEGAEALVDTLLDRMKPGKPAGLPARPLRAASVR